MPNEFFLERAKEYIVKNNIDALTALFKTNPNLSISRRDFLSFINSFSWDTQQKLKNCININGSGGSTIPKLNISSLSAIYLSVITGIDFAKTGGPARTGLCGSTDFFNFLGITERKDKITDVKKYHFTYFDHLELLPWNKYKEILSLNTDICSLLKGTVFFEYPAKIYGIGIVNDDYKKTKHNLPINLEPKRIFTFYTNTEHGRMDEVTQGSVFLGGENILQIPGKLYIPNSKAEILSENMALLKGVSTNKAALTTLRYSVAVLLLAIQYTDSISNGLALFDQSYKEKRAFRLISEIKEHA